MSDTAVAVRPLGIQVPPPLALYIHIPWCVRKCPYCDFNSHALRGDIPEAAYLQALRRDLESALPSVWGRPITSIFIGGGTPSLLSAGALDALLTQVRTLLRLVGGEERVPVYLPEDAARRLPLAAKHRVRVFAEVVQKVDMAEACRWAARALAIGGVQALD